MPPRDQAHHRRTRRDGQPLERGDGQRPRRLGDDALVLIQVEHRRAHGALVDLGHPERPGAQAVVAQRRDQRQVRVGDDLGAEPGDDRVRHVADPFHGGSVDERIHFRQGHRPARDEGSGHRRRPGRFHPDDRGVRRLLVQVRRDAGQAATAADRNQHQVRRRRQLIEHLPGDGALTRRGAGVVERRDHRRAGPRDVLRGRRGGRVEGVTRRDEFDERPAVRADPVPLLLRGPGGHVDPAPDPHRPARVGHALCVIAGTGRHHTRLAFRRGELRHDVVGAAQLVRAHAGEILALEIDVRPGEDGEPLAVLERCGGDDRGNSLRRGLDVGHAQGGQVHRISGSRSSGHLPMLPLPTRNPQCGFRHCVRCRGRRTPRATGARGRRPGSPDPSSSGTRRSRGTPRPHAATTGPSPCRGPRGRSCPGPSARHAVRRADPPGR